MKMLMSNENVLGLGIQRGLSQINKYNMWYEKMFYINKGKPIDSREVICMMELWLELQTVVTLKDILGE